MTIETPLFVFGGVYHCVNMASEFTGAFFVEGTMARTRRTRLFAFGKHELASALCLRFQVDDFLYTFQSS